MSQEFPFRSPWGALSYAQRLYVRNFLVLFAIVLPATLLWKLGAVVWSTFQFQEMLGWLQAEAHRVGGWPLYVALKLAVDVIVGTLTLALIAFPLALVSHAVRERLLGRSASFRKAYQVFGARLGHYGLTMLLLAGLFAVADLLGLALGPLQGIITAVVLILIALVLPYLSVIVVQEGLHGVKALSRSYELLRMSFLPTLLLWPWYFVLSTYADWLTYSVLFSLVGFGGAIALSAVGMAFVASWVGTMLSLLYFEARAATGTQPMVPTWDAL